MATEQDLEKRIKELEELIKQKDSLITYLQSELFRLQNKQQWQISYTPPEFNPSIEFEPLTDPCPKGGNHVYVEDHQMTALQYKCVKCGQYKMRYFNGTNTFPASCVIATEKYDYPATEQYNYPQTEKYDYVATEQNIFPGSVTNLINKINGSIS